MPTSRATIRLLPIRSFSLVLELQSLLRQDCYREMCLPSLAGRKNWPS